MRADGVEHLKGETENSSGNESMEVRADICDLEEIKKNPNITQAPIKSKGDQKCKNV